MKRTEAEIKAYVDGYNDCFERFMECLKGRKSVIDSIRKMELFVTAVNSCVESEPQAEMDRPQGCRGCRHWIYRSNFGEDCEFDNLENCKYEPKDGR